MLNDPRIHCAFTSTNVPPIKPYATTHDLNTSFTSTTRYGRKKEFCFFIFRTRHAKYVCNLRLNTTFYTSVVLYKSPNSKFLWRYCPASTRLSLVRPQSISTIHMMVMKLSRISNHHLHTKNNLDLKREGGTRPETGIDHGVVLDTTTMIKWTIM